MRKSRSLHVIGIAAALLGPTVLSAQGLVFISPRVGQVIGGQNVLLWAAEAIRPPQAAQLPVDFYVSTDGRNFSLLPRAEAPDLGESSYTTALDARAFPPGPLWLRAGGPSGPVVQVEVDLLPRPFCHIRPHDASTVTFDCSLSLDPDGHIQRYEWDFGDRTKLLTQIAILEHVYPGPGEFDFQVTAVDNRGLSSTLQKIVSITPGVVTVKDPDMCGCKEMVITAKGDSFLRDKRRFNDNGTPANPDDDTYDPAPLGLDPDFLSLNFEINAVLKEGSDPELCKEGQRVRRTAKIGAGRAEHKKACTMGQDLPSCQNDRHCDSYTCSGGTEAGKPCNDLVGQQLCLLGGGQCRSNGDGKCTEFPNVDGGARGNDDFRRHTARDLQGLKLHCPRCNAPTWDDHPGQPSVRHAAIKTDFKYEADFLAFVEGDGDCDCSCHFKILIDWDGANQMYRPTSGITLVMDGETKNCSLVK